MSDYNVIADKEVFHAYKVEDNELLYSLIDVKKWQDVIEILEKNQERSWEMRLMSKKERDVGKVQDLNTPLHKAVADNAEKEIVMRLIKTGASKSLRNLDKETPYDIAVKSGKYDAEMVEELKPAALIMDNQDALEAMQVSLQKLVMDIAGSLIEKKGVVLPQTSFLFEKNEAEVIHYLIPGMYGGFNFSVDIDKFEITALSFCRVVGGSEREHIIHKDGSVTENVIPYLGP